MTQILQDLLGYCYWDGVRMAMLESFPSFHLPLYKNFLPLLCLNIQIFLLVLEIRKTQNPQ